jgi:2-dehydropantoate 2-reductase
MKTLIFGAGPIGRWLALRLHQASQDVTLLARAETYESLQQNRVVIVDGLTAERHVARVQLVDRLAAEDRYDLVIVAMQKASRMAVCPILGQNNHIKHILFLGNDVSGFDRYHDYLPSEKVLLGFPGAGGGWDGDDLVIWLKYHFAFIAPTAGAIFAKRGDLSAVATDPELIHRYCQACREAGNVLRAVGYRKRQPAVFNLYYWLPRWLEPKVFGKLFGSRSAEVRFGLHSPVVGPELHEMADEFAALKAQANTATPELDALLEFVPRHPIGPSLRQSRR